MSTTKFVFFFTDFSESGPYTGQLHSRVLEASPVIRVVDLMHDAPRMRPDLAAYLLPRVCEVLPSGAVVIAVVDPGVGGERLPIIVETARATFVGPDNGLMSRLPDIRRVSVIDWRPERLSPSFHGRDLFAPVGAMLAVGDSVDSTDLDVHDMVGADWPTHCDKVVLIDAYGNLMIGHDLEVANEINAIRVGARKLPQAATFSDVPKGTPFWYQNSIGLVEIAVNGGSAAAYFKLALGDKILVS